MGQRPKPRARTDGAADGAGQAGGPRRPLRVRRRERARPIEALLYWQDTIVSQGELIDGGVEFSVRNGKLHATVHPTDGSAPILFEVDSIPAVATGFTHEFAPGTRGRSLRQTLLAVDAALKTLPAADVAQARRALEALAGTTDGEAGQALEHLGGSLLDRVRQIDPAAITYLENQKSFDDKRAADRDHVFDGDGGDQPSDSQIAGMRKVVIAGTGGTGISAAEIILHRNAAARVTMIGKEPPAGLAENNQFRKVVAELGSRELATRLHIKPGRLEGRFAIYDGYYVGPLKGGPGAYDATVMPNDQGALQPAGAATGDTYIGAIGRYTDVPTPLAKLVLDAERAGRAVEKRPLIDEDFYLGYMLRIEQVGGTCPRSSGFACG